MPIVDLLKQFAKKRMQRLLKFHSHGFSRRSHGLFRSPDTQIDHLDENIGAINVQLTAADLREIETAFSAINVQGGRLSERHMQQIDHS